MDFLAPLRVKPPIASPVNRAKVAGTTTALQPTVAATQRESLTAAGVRVDRENAGDVQRAMQQWQQFAFGYYHTLGIIWYAAQFYSRALSQLRLYVARKDEQGNMQPVDDTDEAADLLSRIQDPGGGRSQLQGSFGRLMFLVGEGFLAGTVWEDDSEAWEFLSGNELAVKSDNTYTRFRGPGVAPIQYRSTEGAAPQPGGGAREAVVYRMWRKDPEFSWMADSPMRAILDLCDELQILTLSVRGRAKSRAASAGILQVAMELDFGPAGGGGAAGATEDPNTDPFQDRLQQLLTAATQNVGTAGQYCPIVVRAPAEMIEREAAMRKLDLYHVEESYPEEALRSELIRRIALGLDMPPEILLGMEAANHWPCDETTEVMTLEKGFVTHDRLVEGDLVLSLNHDSGLSEWVPLAGVIREHVSDRAMVRVQTPTLDALTTPDHRWPVIRDGERVWTTAAGLLPEDRIIRAADHATPVPTKVYDDSFVELVGWYLSEGTCTWPSEKHCQVRIGQSHVRNPERVEEIRGTLTETYGEGVATLLHEGRKLGYPAWREDAEPRGMTLFHLNKAAYDPLLAVFHPRTKVLRNEFVLSLTQDQLVLLLETVAKGDGELRASGGLQINQANPERLQPLGLAAALAGRPVMFSSRIRKGGFVEGEQHYLSVPNSQHTRPVNDITGELYTGVIFCPRVPPTKSFLARRNGKVYFTGQTAWQIDDQTWTAHIQPMAQQMADDFTSAYLRPAAREAGIQDWQNLVVAYDNSAVVNHPDRFKDAMDLWDRGLVSGEYLRTAAGATDEDAQSEEEHDEWLAIKLTDPMLLEEGEGGDQPGPTDSSEVVREPPSEERLEEQEAGPNFNAAGVVIGAAEYALARAREAAGARLRSRLNGHDAERALVDKKPNSVVASTLGPGFVTERGLTAASLVSDTTQAFSEVAVRYGIDPASAEKLCQMIEGHAADTLFQHRHDGLPASFTVRLARLLA